MSEKMVIPQSSAFMILSFSSFKRAISSRVISRTSMSLQSSSCLVFLNRNAGSEVKMVGDDTLVDTPFFWGVVNAETVTKKAMKKKSTVRKDIMVTMNILFRLTCKTKGCSETDSEKGR